MKDTGLGLVLGCYRYTLIDIFLCICARVDAVRNAVLENVFLRRSRLSEVRGQVVDVRVPFIAQEELPPRVEEGNSKRHVVEDKSQCALAFSSSRAPADEPTA
jgi:hypothetical protein